jgi:hypothetical protein
VVIGTLAYTSGNKLTDAFFDGWGMGVGAGMHWAVWSFDRQHIVIDMLQ